jgi:hypothetical protein
MSISATKPLELVHIDYLKLDPSKGNVEDVLVITDHFTRYAQAFHTSSQTAYVTAKCLWDNYFSYYGFPDKILSDQGANFESELIQHLCNLAGVKKLRTTPYHPQTNGQCERFNRTLIDMIGTLEGEPKKDWKACIKHLTHAYNCTRNSATGFSPYFLLFGRVPRMAVDVQFGLSDAVTGGNVSKSNYLNDLRKRMRWAFSKAREQEAKLQARNEKNYDKRAAAQPLGEGDLVLVRCTAHKKRHKIQDRWSHDVFEIEKVPDPDFPVYTVRSQMDGRVRTVHRNLLLPVSTSSGENELLEGEKNGDPPENLDESLSEIGKDPVEKEAPETGWGEDWDFKLEMSGLTDSGLMGEDLSTPVSATTWTTEDPDFDTAEESAEEELNSDDDCGGRLDTSEEVEEDGADPGGVDDAISEVSVKSSIELVMPDDTWQELESCLGDDEDSDPEPEAAEAVPTETGKQVDTPEVPAINAEDGLDANEVSEAEGSVGSKAKRRNPRLPTGPEPDRPRRGNRGQVPRRYDDMLMYGRKK